MRGRSSGSWPRRDDYLAATRRTHVYRSLCLLSCAVWGVFHCVLIAPTVREQLKSDHEAASTSRALEVACVAAVSARDLSHESQPQARPGALRGAGESAKRLKDALTLRLGNTRSVIANT